MRGYDEQCAREFAGLKRGVERYFADVNAPCPYGLPCQARFHQASFAPLSERAMELFLAAGYRRNGNCLYAMDCPDCSACLPIRLKSGCLAPNRSQRRAMKKNRDLDVEFGPVEAAGESVELCDRFLAARYPRERSSGESYYLGFFSNMIVTTIEVRYRLAGRLVGVAIVDMGSAWMNAVYFFFDPDLADRSLGTYNILTLERLCRREQIALLYLGYLIREVPAMAYKARFQPHELLVQGEWQGGG